MKRIFALLFATLVCGFAYSPLHVRAQDKSTFTTYTVAFETRSGQLFRAVGGGGDIVDARYEENFGYKTFTLTDLNGDLLESGDEIMLQASNGQYLVAVEGGGSALRADGNETDVYAKFVIAKADRTPGVIDTNTQILLWTRHGYTVTAVSDGGDDVNALRWLVGREWLIGSGEIFTLIVGPIDSGVMHGD